MILYLASGDEDDMLCLSSSSDVAHALLAKEAMGWRCISAAMRSLTYAKSTILLVPDGGLKRYVAIREVTANDAASLTGFKLI